MSEPTALFEMLRNIRDQGYQPGYNGRPSCPFCENFVDDEETHEPECVLLTTDLTQPDTARPHKVTCSIYDVGSCNCQPDTAAGASPECDCPGQRAGHHWNDAATERSDATIAMLREALAGMLRRFGYLDDEAAIIRAERVLTNTEPAARASGWVPSKNATVGTPDTAKARALLSQPDKQEGA